MSKVLFIAAAVAAVFPYTQIISFSSYTQPYAILFAFFASLFCFREVIQKIPGIDIFILFLLFFVGIVVFLLSSLPSPLEQDYKSLLMYVSPLLFTITAFVFADKYPDLFLSIVSKGALTWIGVGIIQTLINPNFATGLVGDWSAAAEVVVASGRGVLGLAPEPTHFGFHMLLLAAIIYILNGNRILIIACMITSIFLAKSSSALLAMLIGGAICLIVRFRQMFFHALLLILIGLFVLWLIIIFANPEIETFRMFSLILDFINEPTNILALDSSVNARVGGVIVGIELIWNDLLLPHGMSSLHWTNSIPHILAFYPWLFDISNSGIPSGFFIVIYQLGFIGLFLLIYPAIRIIKCSRSAQGLWILLTALVIFLGQYLISNPGFGILYGCAIASLNKNRKQNF